MLYLVPKRAEASLSRNGSGLALLCSKSSDSDGGGSFGGLLSGFGSGSASADADTDDTRTATVVTTTANRKWHLIPPPQIGRSANEFYKESCRCRPITETRGGALAP